MQDEMLQEYKDDQVPETDTGEEPGRPILCSACAGQADLIRQMETESTTGKSWMMSIGFCFSCFSRLTSKDLEPEWANLKNIEGFELDNKHLLRYGDTVEGEENDVSDIINDEHKEMTVLISPEFDFLLRAKMAYLGMQGVKITQSKLLEIALRRFTEKVVTDGDLIEIKPVEEESRYVAITRESTEKTLDTEKKTLRLGFGDTND